MNALALQLEYPVDPTSSRLRRFLDEHPHERQRLFGMYPVYRRWVVRLILGSRWIAILEAEIHLVAAISGIDVREQIGFLESIEDAYRRRPHPTGILGWTCRWLEADPRRLAN